MATISVNDITLTLNGRIITDCLEGDTLTLTFPNPKTVRTNSANGVSVKKTVNAEVADLVIRVLKNSDDDIWFNAAMNSSDISVFNGSIKRPFVKDGVSGIETTILEGGTFTEQPTDTINDTEGNEEAQYTLQFRYATRLK